VSSVGPEVETRLFLARSLEEEGFLSRLSLSISTVLWYAMLPLCHSTGLMHGSFEPYETRLFLAQSLEEEGFDPAAAVSFDGAEVRDAAAVSFDGADARVFRTV
jgi:hypothetical protein